MPKQYPPKPKIISWNRKAQKQIISTNQMQKYEEHTTQIDKGLIPTKDDGPWHMLRRKGVP